MDMLKRLLTHLSGLSKLNQVLIIWSSPDTEIIKNLSLPAVDYPIRIFHSNQDSLNIRFSPLRMIETNAVFILDDDSFIDHESLTYAFK